jgi:glycosyltransferase involved in cell wall biosynthesis
MAVARPVVATAIGNLPDIIARHNLGVTARDDPDEFAQQTIALLTDPQRSTATGRSARHAAETVFSWERMTDELEQFYLHVLNS